MGATGSEARSLLSSGPRWGFWAAVGTLLAAAAVDVAYGREASLTVTMVFAPFVASALTPPRDTAVIGVAAAISAFALGWPDGTVGTSAHLVRTFAVAVGAALAVALARQRTRREHKLAAVTRVAEAAQQAILRPLPPRLGPLQLVAQYVSATAEARIGGDFYEALETPWGTRLLVGDVRGKGLDAVRLASSVLGEFRSRAISEPCLGDVVSHVDAAACRFASPGGEDFATAVFAEANGTDVTMVRCGHPQPLTLDVGGVVRSANLAGTLPLGLGANGDVSTSLPLSPGRRVLLYSDGATEARDAQGRDFDLAESFRRGTCLRADRAVQQIIDDLRRHVGGVIGDDVVLILAEPESPPTAIASPTTPTERHPEFSPLRPDADVSGTQSGTNPVFGNGACERPTAAGVDNPKPHHRDGADSRLNRSGS